MSTAEAVYGAFLRDVVIARVFGDAERARDGTQLAAAQRDEIAQGKRIDARAPFLARRSGKGGWSDDPDKAARYARFINVSLLDHACSVVRGAMQLAEIDLRARRDPPEEGELRRRLGSITAIAFLHDADKMLDQPRTAGLDVPQISELMGRFGIDDFLEQHGDVLSAAEMRVLIELAETSQAGRLQGAPRSALHDCTYVRLADRLDSIYLQFAPDPEKPDQKIGSDGVLEELARYDDLDTDAVRHWRAVRISDPHTPFLLDALQVCLSQACRSRHGHPPLLETHHDGTLLVLIPQAHSDAVIETALAKVTGDLGNAIRIEVNLRGATRLLDARASFDELREALAKMPAADREKLLFVNRDALVSRSQEITTLLGQLGFPPLPPDLVRFMGRLVPLWQRTTGMNEAVQAMHITAALVNAVLSCTDTMPDIPDVAQREIELRHLLESAGLLQDAPWLPALPDLTRHTLLAAVAAAGAARDQISADALLGPDGLVALWFEGRGERRGLRDSIAPAGARLAEAVASHYRTLIAGHLVTAPDEIADGRCHFTNAPLPRHARIDGTTGLYGVKVSAFSGREGRPESHLSLQAETLVAPIAEAEHRLRTIVFERPGRSASRRDVPLLVSSPTAGGLFGALAYARGNDLHEYAFADVLRVRKDKGLTYHDGDGETRRVRIARYEEMPTRWASSETEPGQISFVAMAFAAAQRLGRPIHLFRGLPRPRPDFVHFDALPLTIERLLGGTGARLEQLPRAVALLRGIEEITNATGFGVELASRFCDPDTRYSAACDALTRAEKRLAASNPNKAEALRRIVIFSQNILENAMPSENDRAIVAFGEAMALVQRVPRQDKGDNVVELGLRTALDAAERLERMGQVHDDSLVAGVAGEIRKVLARQDLLAARDIRGGRSPDDAIEAAARQFVESIWHGAFGGTVPAARDRRIALATYRFSFARAARARFEVVRHHDNEADTEHQERT